MTLATGQDRTFLLLMWMNIWREVWTDGRDLPTNVGGRGPDAHDPTYNGYSIGHWEDDYTFVVETTGMDPATWVARAGYPHSVDAVVTERFHRSSQNDLSLTVVMDDPALYTGTVPSRGWSISGGFRARHFLTSPAYRRRCSGIWKRWAIRPAAIPMRPFAIARGIDVWRRTAKTNVLMMASCRVRP